MSNKYDWQCPQCDRKFKVPIGKEIEICPDCKNSENAMDEVLGLTDIASSPPKESSTRSDSPEKPFISEISTQTVIKWLETAGVSTAALGAIGGCVVFLAAIISKTYGDKSIALGLAAGGAILAPCLVSAVTLYSLATIVRLLANIEHRAYTNRDDS